MWHIIIQRYQGGVFRAVSEDKPTQVDIEYWEDYCSEHISAHSDQKLKAVVTNIYETED